MRVLSGTRFLTAPRILVLSFAAVIGLGAAVLMLPGCTTRGISPTDALFTSASAVCVTGLIVQSTPDAFTPAGKAVILGLIQVGGLGYMAFSTMFAIFFGRRIGFTERFLLKESMNISSLEGIVGILRKIVLFVCIAEGAGAVLLALGFSRHFGVGQSLLYGVFFSISAFNNAGFSLFNDSLMGFGSDLPINLVFMALIVVGGLGFVVVLESAESVLARRMRLQYHARVVLTATGVLIVLGAVLFYVSEARYLFRSQEGGVAGHALASLFSSVTARTAGFNTVDFSLLQPITLFLVILLMVVGASPGSTGGGIKTTTVTVIFMHIWCTLRGQADTSLFRRRLGEPLIAKAFVIFALSIIFINIVTFAIIGIEHSAFEPTLFEVVSAFATVGLSVGDGGVRSLSATFSDASKLLIVLTMIAGRVGPLTLFAALLEKKPRRYRYPEGGVLIG